jgi:HEAT repeat protein
MLSRALTDAHPSVRQAAALALMRARDAAPDAVPALVRTLKDPDELVRAAAVMALGAVAPASTGAVRGLQGVVAADPPNRAVAERTIKKITGGPSS